MGLEMSGNGAAFNSMINNMYNGGKIAVLGIQSSETLVPWNKIVWNCLEIKGIYGREMFESWYQNDEHAAQRVEHRKDPDSINSALRTMKKGSPL